MVTIFVVLSACGATSAAPPPPSPTADSSTSSTNPASSDAAAVVDASLVDVKRAEKDANAETQVSKCPSDMVYVEHDYCPEVQRRCIYSEYNRPNRITLCHAFEEGSTQCKAERQKLKFCIDKYEYPNREGAHPPWMVSWYDAEATCRSLGKRTCWDWEWVAACEGPDETPFPYGWRRDNTKCNIDNTWIEPRLSLAYSSDKKVANRELSRLDQSVASGAMPECVSGYGVHDLTGNLDEWVTRAGRNRTKSKWSGLKGGGWGHVRNACRPITTSHTPEFEYYFITFRCCKDPEGALAYVPPGSTPPPEVKAEDRAPIPHPNNPTGPSARKIQPQRIKR